LQEIDFELEVESARYKHSPLTHVTV